MDIELFAAEKTCEQGCVRCPLARKERGFTKAVKIDKNVQQSFTLLEHALHVCNVNYNLHTTSALHLFPKIGFPELIQMARFETSRDIKINGNARKFSDSIQRVLTVNRVSPKTIGFSVVPNLPVVSPEDMDVIDAILREVSGWHFKRPNRSIDVTIRSNLINVSLFRLSSPRLLQADELLLRNTLKAHVQSVESKTKKPFYEQSQYFLYYNEYCGSFKKRKITISNRVIAHKKVGELAEVYYDQALDQYGCTKFILDIAIAPKGIMMMHTSLAINNPMLWVSHGEFKKILAQELKKQQPSFKKLIQNTISQNAVMYKLIQEKKKKGMTISHTDYMNLYEKWRSKFF